MGPINAQGCRSCVVLLVTAACLVGTAAPVAARITRIEITGLQSPTFEGASFGSAGAYEKLTGRIHGEVDPAAPLNAIITDIALAPKNARGMVEYSANLMIIRPVDPAKGNHRLLMEINNRGGILTFGLLNDAKKNTSDPTSAADAANGFMMRQGYTMAFSGWDPISSLNPAARGGPFLLDAPVARNPDGSEIVGLSLEEFAIDAPNVGKGALSYPAASLDTTKAELTMRAQEMDKPIPVPADKWRYEPDGNAISLLPEGTNFTVGRLYELIYPAKNPKVAGLGYASVRDFAAFLRYRVADDQGHPNPLAGQLQEVYSTCVSQPCRFMREFVGLGFNEDDDVAGQKGQPRKAFDGVLNWIGGGSGLYLNYRFAEPFRTHREHIARWYPEFRFPFAYQTTVDSVTGRTDGLMQRCTVTGTCPNIIEVNSDNEYWSKDGAVLHTDTESNDLPDMPGLREYLLASLPHGDGIPPSGPGICQQDRNPLVGNAALRALLVGLDRWVTSGVAPPPSRVPRHADGTLTSPAQQDTGFPRIPGVTYNARMHTGDLFDFGPDTARGITTQWPPTLLGSPYPVAVPKADADGNTVAGIRLPDIAAPTATYTGWNLRRNPPGEGCDHAGMYLPFARTRAERVTRGDPRLSLDERYPDHGSYVQAVTKAADALRDQGLLLDEDVERYTQAAQASGVRQ